MRDPGPIFHTVDYKYGFFFSNIAMKQVNFFMMKICVFVIGVAFFSTVSTLNNLIQDRRKNASVQILRLSTRFMSKQNFASLFNHTEMHTTIHNIDMKI